MRDLTRYKCTVAAWNKVGTYILAAVELTPIIASCVEEFTDTVML